MPKTYYISNKYEDRIAGPFYEMGEAYRALEAEEEMSPDEEFYLEIDRS